MLYLRNQLNELGNSVEEVMKRYFHKYFNQKKDFIKLKLHEKDFFWGCLHVTYNDTGRLAFNLYKIPEAKEYLFNSIILTYYDENGNFLKDDKTVLLER